MVQKQRSHSTTGMVRLTPIPPDRVEVLLHGAPATQVPRELSAGAIEARRTMEQAMRQLQSKQEVKQMTVSLYTSTASGKKEVVVQTNAQSLDLFIAGLADALNEAVSKVSPDDHAEMLASIFRNAFPVAFAIAGYKAEKVVESRTLSCGAAAPEKSSLLAHSRT
jgi:hypothetical protein